MKATLALLTLLAASSATAQCGDGSRIQERLPRGERKELCPGEGMVLEIVNGTYGRCVDNRTCLPLPICNEDEPQCEVGCDNCVEIIPRTRYRCSVSKCVDNSVPFQCGDGSSLLCRRGPVFCENPNDYAPVILGCYGKCVDRLTCLPSPPMEKPPMEEPEVTEDEPLPPSCGVNEMFFGCGTNCEPTCSFPGPQLCNQACNMNVCQCKPGFVRHNGVCVTLEECPAQEEPELTGVDECFFCTLAIPECEVGCETCEISRQTCTECSAATCLDEDEDDDEEYNFLLFLHKLFKQHLKFKGNFFGLFKAVR